MDTSQELREIQEELSDIEKQLEHLLERQQQLLSKQRRLQQVLKDEAKTANDDAEVKWDKSDFPWSKEIEEKRNVVFGISSFRPLQRQTMNTTMAGKDCILVMPTGGGKSLCFQLTAVISPGITLVVSPLISLMEDQLYALNKVGVEAKLLNASSTKEEVNWVHNTMTDKKNNDLKLLYVTPEKLAKSKRFMNKLEKMYELGRFSRLVIDEVHCCSQWGHDFRPDYKFLGIMKKQFPKIPILGLTATATSTVLTDVKKILGIQSCVTYKASFNRKNLFYEVRSKPGSFKACMDDMCNLIKSRFRGESGIVYCLTQKDTEEVASELTSRGIRAQCYHANLNASYRSRVHEQWIADKTQVVVATIAFGMGIDKPDVRFVIHHSISKSMENYYQESGRAGRDSSQSWCILYSGFQDLFRQSTMVFTEQTGLEKLYNMISYAYNLDRCRRSLIASHFGEKWDSDDCNQMCDHCKPNDKVVLVNKDMTKHCRDVIETLHKNKGKVRMTGLKLMDSWLGKGKNSLLSRQDAEALIVYMVMQGYLREDFHFTAYTTISYLLPGPREHTLMKDTCKIEIPYEKPQPRKTLSDTKKSNSEPEKSTNSTKTVTQRVKPIPCVVNTQKSSMTESLFLSEFKDEDKQKAKVLENGHSSAAGVSGTQTKPKGSVVTEKKKKRKKIIYSDSDSDFLEFDDEDFSPPKKQKVFNSQKTMKSSDKTSTNSEHSGLSEENMASGKVGSKMNSSITNGGVTVDEDIAVISDGEKADDVSNCITLDDSD